MCDTKKTCVLTNLVKVKITG